MARTQSLTMHNVASETKMGSTEPPERMPKFWDGMSFPAWRRLVTKNHFRLAARYWSALPLITALSLFHSAYRLWQWVVVGWRIKRKIDSPPLFILGHWRSGTTLLHELLVLDQRHTFPTTYECFAPNHFVLTEWAGTRLFAFLVPRRRPMDNMAAGWHRPQEDEFALCNLGVPSPYLTIAFPNEPPQDQEYWTLEGVAPEAVARWKKVFLRFLQEINHRAGRRKRIVLKSPPHTGRVKILLEMFPDAKFVHIVRNPFVIFPSTVHLWKTLYAAQGLQQPNFAGLEEYVFANLTRMYERFENDRQRIPPGNFSEIRYEDLVREPVDSIRRVYDELGLAGFDEALPALEAFVSSMKGYQPNKYRELAPAVREQIARRWRGYIERYGYAPQPSGGPRDEPSSMREESSGVRSHRGAGAARGATIDAS